MAHTHTATHCTHCKTLQHTDSVSTCWMDGSWRIHTLQHTGTYCNTLQHTESVSKCRMDGLCHTHILSFLSFFLTKSSALHMMRTALCLHRTPSVVPRVQHTSTLCNTLQHAATRCNTLQHTATHCNTLQHTATHCNTLQRTPFGVS